MRGIYGLIALAAGPQIEVVTFDLDFPRLAGIRRLCDDTLEAGDCGSFTGLSGKRPPR